MRIGQLVRTFVLRDLNNNAVRSLLTVLGIALGVAVMLSINIANGTALARFKSSIDLVAGKSNLEVHAIAGSDFDEQLLNKLVPLWNDNLCFTPIIDQVAVTAMPNRQNEVLQVLGIDVLSDSAFRSFEYRSNSTKSDSTSIFSAGAAYVGEALAKKYGLRVGDELQLLVNDKAKSIKVADIIASSGAGSIFGGNLLVMDIGSAQQLFDMQGRISRIDLLVPDENFVQLRQTIRSLMPESLTIERPSRRTEQVEKMVAAFQYNLSALSLIALLVGMFVIYNTMSMTVIRKRQDIGILRALGASRRHVLLIFFLQALCLGALGSLVGVGLGVAFAQVTVKAVASTVHQLYVDEPAVTVGIDASILVVAFLSGILVTLVAAAGPIWEAMSIAPAQATRRGSFERRVESASFQLLLIGLFLLCMAGFAACLPPMGTFPVCGFLSAALLVFGFAFCLPLLLRYLVSYCRPIVSRLIGSEGKLAILSLGGTLGRTSVTVASLMLGISMMVSLSIMIGSFRQTVIVWVEQTLKADLYVESQLSKNTNRKGKIAAEVVDAIRRADAVDDVSAYTEFPIEYNGSLVNLGAANIQLLIKHNSLMLADGVDKKAVLTRLLDQPACIVSESFALHNGVHCGDRLTLPGAKGTFTVEVAGISYDYSSDQGCIMLPRWLYNKYFNDTYSTALGIYVKPGIDTEVARSQILSNLDRNVRLNIRTNSNLRRDILRIFDNTFEITYALQVIAIIVAILGVINALFALTFEMRREFAILTYLGTSARQIRKVILVQAITLAGLGSGAGIFVGFILSLLLIHVINLQSFGWTIQLSIPVLFLAQSFILILLSALFAGWWPAHLAAKTMSPEAVRVE